VALGAGAGAASADCGKIDRAGYAPPFTWSKTYKGQCGHISTAAKPTITVAWEVPFFSSGKACVKARGYRWSDGKAYWTSLGCGSSGHGTVHWGKVGGPDVLSVSAVKGTSQALPLGTPFYFTD
jgi:hypothetical protein